MSGLVCELVQIGLWKSRAHIIADVSTRAVYCTIWYVYVNNNNRAALSIAYFLFLYSVRSLLCPNAAADDAGRGAS